MNATRAKTWRRRYSRAERILTMACFGDAWLSPRLTASFDPVGGSKRSALTVQYGSASAIFCLARSMSSSLRPMLLTDPLTSSLDKATSRVTRPKLCSHAREVDLRLGSIATDHRWTRLGSVRSCRSLRVCAGGTDFHAPVSPASRQASDETWPSRIALLGAASRSDMAARAEQSCGPVFNCLDPIVGPRAWGASLICLRDLQRRGRAEDPAMAGLAR